MSSQNHHEDGQTSAGVCLQVRLATPLPFKGGCLDYLAPHDLPAGQMVIAPLGNRQVAGIVAGPGDGDVPEKKLKSIKAVSDLPPLADDLMAFMDQVSEWTLSVDGAVLKMAIPALEALTGQATRTAWQANEKFSDDGSGRLTPKRRAVLAALRDAPPLPVSEAALLTGVSPSTITAMGKAGLLEPVEIASPLLPRPDPGHQPPTRITLNDEQSAAASRLKDALTGGKFAPFVLDGVTGSGKTEVYLDATAQALEQQKQVLILLPEIALSPMLQDRFTERFGTPPVVWHSALTPGQRITAYRSVAKGGARVVIGARSALFLPYPDLAMIIVDEEHDQSYKQEDHVVYHARDMAVLRAQRENIPVVLASATPSLETEYNVEQGKYSRLRLTARIGTAVMPRIELLDLRQHRLERQRWMASPLIAAVKDVLSSGQQSLLFLNRRGYAPMTLCRTCGDRMTCPHCSAWLVTHKRNFTMRCHHCGFSMRIPEKCPSCEDEGGLVPCGPGVERLAEEAAHHFPEARLAVLSSDLVTTPQNMKAFMEEITAGNVDIIIGTQMIAKGHHFPKLKLVGVVDADLGLAGGDLRAAETTWQLMVQVAGRAGRTGEEGRAFLQTVAPETAVFQALARGDRAAFLEAEKSSRQLAEMPPYGRLAAIILSSENKDILAESVKKLAERRPHFDSVSILGPAEAPIALLRGRHRIRFLIKTPRDIDIQKIIHDWLETVSLPSSVRLQVDIDPYSFL
jgi:primosomal protein N' (replication factor Y)